MTAGFGTFNANGSIASDSYVTAALSSSGNLLVAYLPIVRTITVDMSRLSGPATARWYDPTSGTFKEDEVAQLPNRESRHFTPPLKNAAGDEDWVLVLETGRASNATAD